MTMKTYYLTDGKYYVADNKMKPGEYILTSYTVNAKEFTYKAADNLQKRKGKKWTQFHNMRKVEVGTGKVEQENKKLGNGGAFLGDRAFKFDKGIIGKVKNETSSIMNLAGWDNSQLQELKDQLTNGLSFYDSAESDLKHVLEEYRDDHNGKKPQAHKVSQIGYILEEIRELRRDIKEEIRCVNVMLDANTYNYTIKKCQTELANVKRKKYQGRTEYYQMAIDILEK